MRLRPLLSSTLLVLAACAARAPLTPPTAPFPMKEAWRVALAAAGDERLAGPVVGEGETLFLSLESGAVRALDVTTGKPRWETRLHPGALAVAPGLLILKQRDGVVVSLDPATGSARWTTVTDVLGDLPPTIHASSLAVAGQTLTLLDVASGRQAWTTGGVGTLSTTPVFSGARLLVGTSEGLLRCFDLTTGRDLWTLDVGRPIDAPPAVDGRGRAFVGAGRGRILGVDVSFGKVKWVWRVGAETPEAGLVLKDAVVFASNSAVAHALACANGNVAWRAALPSRPLAAAVGRGDILLVLVYGDRENRSTLVALSEQGKRLGTFDIEGEAVGAPVVLGEYLVVAMRDQTLLALVPAPPPPPAATPAAGAAPASGTPAEKGAGATTPAPSQVPPSEAAPPDAPSPETPPDAAPAQPKP